MSWGGSVLDWAAMPKFGEFVKKRREEHGWTQQQLAARMDGSVPNVQRIERMAAPTMQGRTYAALAKALNLTTDELDRAWRGTAPTQRKAHEHHPQLGRPIPIINRVFASRFSEKTNLEYAPADGYTYAPQVTDPEAFAYVVEGRCMEPEYLQGDVVICSPNAKFLDGHDYFVQLTADRDSLTTFKRVFFEGEEYLLKPIAPGFEETRVRREDVFSMARALFVQRAAGPRTTGGTDVGPG